jgi:hypothetical protein
MTMTKKRLLLLASLPLTIALTVGVLAMLPPTPGVTKANFDRIEKRMTKAEVEEIFGGKGELGGPKFGMFWQAHNGSGAEIQFWDDCVNEKHWSDSNETFLNQIQRWLHLR